MQIKPFVVSVTEKSETSRRLYRESYRGYFETEDEAIKEVSTWVKDTSREIKVDKVNQKDIAQQYLDELKGKIEALIVEAMDSGDLYGNEEDGHPDIVGELREMVGEVVFPYFESDDPMGMGWVGSDGRP